MWEQGIMLVINVTTRNKTGIAKNAIGLPQKAMLVKNVVENNDYYY